MGKLQKNAYTRGKEHLNEYRNRAAKFVSWRHFQECHDNENWDFRKCVIGQYRNDAMLRQISESEQICSTKAESLINDKT